MIRVRDLPQSLQDILGDRNLVVFDGTCVLCSEHFRFMLRHDAAQVFHFATAQSPLGQRLFVALHLPTEDFETNLVILDGVVHRDIDAIAAALRGLGWPWRILSAIRFLPSALKPSLYGILARNRYRVFGKTDQCLVPDGAVRARFAPEGWMPAG